MVFCSTIVSEGRVVVVLLSTTFTSSTALKTALLCTSAVFTVGVGCFGVLWTKKPVPNDKQHKTAASL